MINVKNLGHFPFAIVSILLLWEKPLLAGVVRSIVPSLGVLLGDDADLIVHDSHSASHQMRSAKRAHRLSFIYPIEQVVPELTH